MVIGPVVVVAVMLGCAGKPAPAVAVAPMAPPAASVPGLAPPAPDRAPAPIPLDTRRAQLAALLAEQWEDALRRAPDLASTLGDRRYNDRWADRRPEAIAADLAKDRDFLARFTAIDPTGFPDQEALSLQLMIRGLRQTVDDARFEAWLMPVTQWSGPHLELPELVPLLPFATVKDYEDYVARLAAIPRVLEETIALMRLGMAKQLMPPRMLLEQCVHQAVLVARSKGKASPFAQPVARFPTGITKADQARLRAAVLTAIRDRVAPAYLAFARFLKDEYVAHGRVEFGVWSLPDGDARYAALVAAYTTTPLSADEIHQLGLREVARIEREEAAIGRSLGFADLAAFRAHVRVDRTLYAKSRADILARFETYTAQMYAKLPTLFGRLPTQQMVIQRVPSFSEKEDSGAHYEQGAVDGSRPAIVYVNTYQATKRPTPGMEATAYHEGVPGHHLQIALQQELGDLPPFRQQAYYGAFMEGWALYAEHLGKEVGFYQDPYDDYGRLEEEMLRAIRLVVDTGFHAKRWNRDQVVQYFHDHSTIDEASVQAETDRYAADPGQALAYKVGQLTISALRARAEAALGPRFDLRAFHDELLGAGALPLDVLEARIAAWIATQQRP